MLEANKVLYPELQIVRFWWPKNAEKPGPQGTAKTTSTLEANRIEEGKDTFSKEKIERLVPIHNEYLHPTYNPIIC